MRYRIGLIAAILLALYLGQSLPAAAATNRHVEDMVQLKSVRDILEKDVISPKGTLLGTVGDVVVNKKGEITYLVLTRGSAFGNVGPYFPIPWRVANPQLQKRNIRIDLNEQVIENAPGIKMKDWPAAFFTPAFLKRVHTYYQQVETGKKP